MKNYKNEITTKKLPRVSIVILNWNGLKDTIECLESLKQITYPNYEVIVVDNGSKGNDTDVLEEKYGDYIKLIRNKENLGFAGGNNVAIREVIKEGKSEYILTLNNDTKVEPNFLDELIKIAESDPKIGFCQSKILSIKNPKIIDAIGIGINKHGMEYQIGYNETDKRQYNKQEIFGACAASALYKTEMLNQIGLFDEVFFSFYEDVDLSWRARLMDWNCMYVPTSIVYHIHSASTFQFKKYFLVRNKYYYIIKNLPLNKVVLFLIKRPASSMFQVLKCIKNKDFKSIRFYLKGNFDGLKSLPVFLKKRKQTQATKVISAKDIIKRFNKNQCFQ